MKNQRLPKKKQSILDTYELLSKYLLPPWFSWLLYYIVSFLLLLLQHFESQFQPMDDHRKLSITKQYRTETTINMIAQQKPKSWMNKKFAHQKRGQTNQGKPKGTEHVARKASGAQNHNQSAKD